MATFANIVFSMSSSGLQTPTDFYPLQQKMKEKGFFGEYLNDKPVRLSFWFDS